VSDDGPEQAHAAATAAFVEGRPHEAWRLLGQAARGGVDGELLADAAAIAARTHGPVLAEAMVALGEAVEDGHEGLRENAEALAEQRTHRLIPEVVGRVVFAAQHERTKGNVDAQRWPSGKPTRTPTDSVATLRYLVEHGEELEWLADRLDPESREVITQRLVYLVLDHERTQVGPPIEVVHELVAVARAQLMVAPEVRGLGFLDSVERRDFVYSHRFDLTPMGYPIRLETSMFGVQGTFQLEQYRCPHAIEAHVRPGDVVVDGGGYLGETALYFAHHVGPEGFVLCCEFEPSSLTILRENLAANPELAARIEICERALWSESGVDLPVLASGPGTTVKGVEKPDHLVSTASVDDLVADGTVERVDFLKLDIEGAEREALAGARHTLRTQRPRLAIAAYHAFDDVWALTRQIDDLDAGYRFAFAHFTPHHEETVLFAWAEDGPPPSVHAPGTQPPGGGTPWA
jgi:FkbM family methyltransferase